MNRFAWISCVGVLALTGCAENAPPSDAGAHASAVSPAATSSGANTSSVAPAVAAAPKAPAVDSDQRVIATLNGEPVRLQELIGPLIEAHGLTMLLNLIQLDVVKQIAAKSGIVVTPADVQAEHEETLTKMLSSPDDKLQDQLDKATAANNTAEIAKLRPQVDKEHAQLFQQFLDQQHMSRSEFEMIMEINAYLHKIAEPLIQHAINDESLHAAFNQLYGETVRVRHIQLSNPQQIQAAQKRLAAGESFEDVAKSMSENKLSGPLGGELPRFSRVATGYPENFKEVAFSLKPGQISDPVEAGGAYHLIKLEERLAPRAVTFESQKENVRRELTARALQAAIKKLRADVAARALNGLKIEDPMLKKQYDEERAAHAASVKDREQMRADMDKEHKQSLTQPDGSGAAPPASAPPVLVPPAIQSPPTTNPAPEQLRPPATQPAQGASTRPAAG